MIFAVVVVATVIGVAVAAAVAAAAADANDAGVGVGAVVGFTIKWSVEEKKKDFSFLENKKGRQKKD